MEKPRDAAGQPLEIERKFLIAYPDTARLDRLCRARLSITQTYLTRGEDDANRRVRRCVSPAGIQHFYTEKSRVTARTRIERERELSRPEYEALLQQADPARQTIQKTRWQLPLGARTLEVDVFPFWQGQAFCEVELADEDEPLTLPDWLTVLREVTDDPRYTNSALARQIPPEDAKH